MSSMDDKNRIENLKELLDSRVARKIERKHVNLQKPEEASVARKWETDELNNEFDESPMLASAKVSSFAWKVFFISILFFLVAAGAAVGIYYNGVNTVSSDNVAITIAGPTSIDGGAELNLDVTLQNKNSIDLDTAKLIIEYPDGARDPDDVTKPLGRVEEYIGEIASGELARQKIRAIIYGDENQKKSIQLTVEYRVKGSNNVFESRKSFDIGVTSSPISVVVQSLTEINSAQSIEFTVDVTSNATKPLKNILLKTQYGFGFTFTDSLPTPYVGKDTWLIGDLNPGQKKTIRVRGVIEGQDGEDRAFHFAVGIKGVKNDTALEPEFASVERLVSIKKPFVGMQITLDGTTDTQVAVRTGRTIQGELTWTNNLPTKINDLRIELSLQGLMLDRRSVQANRGFYNSNENKIVWDKNTFSDFALVSPGDKGSLTFTFATIVPDISNLPSLRNSELTIAAHAQGKRVEDVNVPLEALADATRKVRVLTDLNISPRAVYSVGPFKNTGPIPPKVEQETTYTVVLSATNSLNDARETIVTATIPFYVKWKDMKSPATEDVAFDQETGKMVWRIGEMKAGTGFSTSPRQLSFQVSFTPSLSQLGSIPSLVKDLTIEGIDRFTNTTAATTKNDLTIRLSTDPQYSQNTEAVQK